MTITKPTLNRRSLIGLIICCNYRINEQIVGNRTFKIRRTHFHLNMDKKLGYFAEAATLILKPLKFNFLNRKKRAITIIGMRNTARIIEAKRPLAAR